MIDNERFAEWLRAYKRDLPSFWPEERYKWEAVKTFQDHFDISAEDLRGMLEASLADCDNLLTTANRFPAGMLLGFAEAYPDRVRAMLVDLFDESKDMWERIDAFKKEADDYREETKGWNESHGKGYNHYQDENSITTYLWLRYPTKHYIYKYGIARTLWQEFKTGRPIKKGAYASNVRNDEATYDEIRERLEADAEVRGILDSLLEENCDHDDALHTLTVDFGHYVWHHMTKGNGLPSLDEASNDEAKEAEGPAEQGYWWLVANPSIWSYASIGIGEEETYTLYNENGHKRRIFQNFLDARPGDPIVGYASTPIRQVVALGQITREQDGKVVYFEKTEDLARPIPLAEIQGNPTLAKMEYLSNTQGSLYRLTAEEYAAILDLAGHEEDTAVLELDDEEDDVEIIEPYGREDFLSEVYMSKERYEQLCGVLTNKLNLILQGAPGVGKTFCARRLAWSIMGCRDDSRIQMVQFHQSYTYEDFIMGYKPDGEGFALREGVFYRFCKRAEADPGNKYFFIIDEINRGNLSKVLGELMMLIEKPYRGVPLTLAYRDEEFSVPENLYIIGMMNTADRSLALIDYALRRRFAFFEMRPGFDSEVFQAYQEGLDSDTLNQLVEQVQLLNSEIRQDPTLGKGFEIGHSHLCGRETCDDEWLREVVDFDIVPTLEEYWFDDTDKVDRWKATLRGVFQ